jgi:hypothetical protein
VKKWQRPKVNDKTDKVYLWQPNYSGENFSSGACRRDDFYRYQKREHSLRNLYRGYLGNKAVTK